MTSQSLGWTPMSGSMATTIARSHIIGFFCLGAICGSADFKVSTGWFKSFKSRHGIYELQTEGESWSGDNNYVHNFKKTFLHHVEEEGFSRDVYKVDETEINWKDLPRKSLASKRESTTPGFKVSKERATVMVCANASGTHTLPLLVIGKSKKPRCFKNVLCLPTLYLQGTKECVDEICLFSE
ncbi:jerky protein homolog-like [Trichonephila clavipes]|nr:jerky protein homolog-like [Trichonephila clavipes]